MKHVIESCIAFYCVKPGEQVVTSYLNSHPAYEDLPQDLRDEADKYEYWAQFDKDNSIYQFDDDSLNKGMDELLAIFEGNLKATGRKNNDALNCQVVGYCSASRVINHGGIMKIHLLYTQVTLALW